MFGFVSGLYEDYFFPQIGIEVKSYMLVELLGVQSVVDLCGPLNEYVDEHEGCKLLNYR